MLLGDSAHPLLSFTSQGASSALEDSYLLSQLLEDKSRFSNTSELYERFYQIRKPIINECIRGGRVLLEQFLYPEKYKKIDLPFVSYATK
jgi:2-polyprenyl-6-methoxyphenol hydroxylase-like FAD-dependent oxidoreductase